jgi:hypothetical protein
MYLRYKPNRHLDRLQKILNFDVSDSFPGPTFLFLDAVSRAGIFAAILSTPVILWDLYKLKRYGWLISFVLFIVLPTFAFYTMFDLIGWLNVLVLFPLLFLGLYYYILRLTIPNWREPIFTTTPGSDYQQDQE